MKLVTGALVASVLLTLAACGSSTSSASPTQPNVIRAGESFLRRYVDGDGRVVRRDQGGDTVSEGQAYGMLIAAGLGDWKRFDTIWAWTRSHLRRPDGLLSFRWAGGHVVGSQPATDADLDAARALLVAGCARGSSGLRHAGVALGRAVLAHETARRGAQVIVAAGSWATGQPVTVNPSYVAPATLHALAVASGDRAFALAADDGRALVAKLATPLPPDWATVDARGNATPSGPPGQNMAAQYGFDAGADGRGPRPGGAQDRRGRVARVPRPAARRDRARTPPRRLTRRRDAHTAGTGGGGRRGARRRRPAGGLAPPGRRGGPGRARADVLRVGLGGAGTAAADHRPAGRRLPLAPRTRLRAAGEGSRHDLRMRGGLRVDPAQREIAPALGDGRRVCRRGERRLASR